MNTWIVPFVAFTLGLARFHTQKLQLTKVYKQQLCENAIGAQNVWGRERANRKKLMCRGAPVIDFGIRSYSQSSFGPNTKQNAAMVLTSRRVESHALLHIIQRTRATSVRLWSANDCDSHLLHTSPASTAPPTPGRETWSRKWFDIVLNDGIYWFTDGSDVVPITNESFHSLFCDRTKPPLQKGPWCDCCVQTCPNESHEGETIPESDSSELNHIGVKRA